MMWDIAALLIAQLSAGEQSVGTLNKYERLGEITATISHCIIFGILNQVL